MFSITSFQSLITKNQSRIKVILLLFAIYSLVAPFSGYLELQSNLVSYFKVNFSHISQFPTEMNPIFIVLEFFMYEINAVISFIFPKLWGPENYFFMRFLLKLPLFITFIVIPFLLERIVLLELKDEQLATRAFYFQLFNLPLMYTTFILGTPECLILFFILLQWYTVVLWNKKENIDTNWYFGIFLSGFLFGIAISFSYILILLIFVFIYSMKFKKALVYLLSIIFANLLILAPIFISNFSEKTIFFQTYYGIQNILIFVKMEYLSIFVIILELVLIVILNKFPFLHTLDRLLINSVLLLILTVNLPITIFIVLTQLFIFGMLKNFTFTTKYRIRSLNLDNLPSGLFYFPVLIMYIATILYLFFNYKITDTIYLKIIVLGPIGLLNRWFWSLNQVIEFNIAFYILFTFLLLATSILTIKKRENHTLFT